MPVALFTYHAYGSWLPDRPQGYVERNRGIHPTNKKLATIQRGLLTQPEVSFDSELQRAIIERFQAICQEEGYRAHAAASEASHVHLLASWRDFQAPMKQVGGRIKNLISLHLSREHDCVGHKWFARGASRQQVESRRHFEHLVNAYLPKHSGWFWREEIGWRDPR
ncbi:hypothetical protein Pla123a_37140 [Posidoniimonas polymericola]|uniref:Transposase IS200-like domain-containing protein n=1 Tax=Posidoniimonas polymericola TaxID=2528002 RepID=A0A5C5YEQ2_9BACT|nr:hypothetical protein [Posidoniimonas polymericola]TWT73820.1 hypothetical protein Pla123a_37140 [Posidoniimonas polymericola]